MSKTYVFGVGVGLAVMLASGAAFAQQRTYPQEPQPYNQPYQEPAYYGDRAAITPFGMAFTVGGGVTGFTGEDLRETTDVGGTWEARVIAGTRRNIGGELAYVGTAQSINAVGADGDATLLGSGVEGALRVNFLTGAFTPFAVVGAGWRHYDLTRTEGNLGALQDNDNVLIVPLGAGISYSMRGLMLDLRGSIRPPFSSDLVSTAGGGGHSSDERLELRVGPGVDGEDPGDVGDGEHLGETGIRLGAVEATESAAQVIGAEHQPHPLGLARAEIEGLGHPCLQLVA